MLTQIVKCFARQKNMNAIPQVSLCFAFEFIVVSFLINLKHYTNKNGYTNDEAAHKLKCQQHDRAEVLAGFKSDDASSTMAAGQLHTARNRTRYYRWPETRRAQAQFPVTFISAFYFSSLI